MSSTTSSHHNLSWRYTDDDPEEFSAVFFLLLIHIALLLARASGIIKWSWWLILLPEVLYALGLVVFIVAGIYFVLRERRRGHKNNGK